MGMVMNTDDLKILEREALDLWRVEAPLPRKRMLIKVIYQRVRQSPNITSNMILAGVSKFNCGQDELSDVVASMYYMGLIATCDTKRSVGSYHINALKSGRGIWDQYQSWLESVNNGTA